jgi:hypothetical protein
MNPGFGLNTHGMEQFSSKRIPIAACAVAFAFLASLCFGQVRCVTVEDHISACGISGRVSPSARFEVTEKRWDPALRSWIFLVRCARASDCLPFWVRESGASSSVSMVRETSSLSLVSPEGQTALGSSATLLVHPGEAAMLVWDQDGISVVVPAICLDRGAKGESVRARIAASGRIVRAIVLEAKRLQAAS